MGIVEDDRSLKLKLLRYFAKRDKGVRKDEGLNFKLDVGLYQLDQQVAYQREAYCTVFFEAEGQKF